MWSTGSLSLAHKGLAENCQACHVNKFEAVTDKTCLTCHKENSHEHADPARLTRAMAPPGLGGTIKASFQTSFGIPKGRCVECHTEHEGAGKMQPTAQQFCSDCHGSLKERLTDTKLPNAGDFGNSHPQFTPAITVGMNGHDRLTRRVELTGTVREDNGLKFPHDIHLSKTNGIARMAQTMRSEQGWGASLVCKDCHTPTADGTRFKPMEMESNCAMCHSLAFDRIGGTIRTLRHGEPAQVVADLRAFYRSTTPERPINLGGMARRRPGDLAAIETATDYTLGARAWPGQADEAIRAVFSRGGACYDCHTVTATGAGFDVRKVFQPARYMTKGWFDHEAHKTEECASCHKAGESKVATDLLLPDLKSCRTCHVGETGATLASVKKPVESTCAMCHDYHFDGSAPWLAKHPPQKTAGRVKQVSGGAAAP
jgi:predicted CXXCH cytochrome family protein